MSATPSTVATRSPPGTIFSMATATDRAATQAMFITPPTNSSAIDGEEWSARAGDLVDQACEGVLNMEGKPIVLDNASHPVNARIALAKAVRSVFDVFGIQWRDETGTRNGHYSPFSWSG